MAPQTSISHSIFSSTINGLLHIGLEVIRIFLSIFAIFRRQDGDAFAETFTASYGRFLHRFRSPVLCLHGDACHFLYKRY